MPDECNDISLGAGRGFSHHYPCYIHIHEQADCSVLLVLDKATCFITQPESAQVFPDYPDSHLRLSGKQFVTGQYSHLYSYNRCGWLPLFYNQH